VLLQPPAETVVAEAGLVFLTAPLSLLGWALLRRVFLGALEKPMWSVLRLLAGVVEQALLVVRPELLAQAAMGATVLSHPSMGRQHSVLAVVVVEAGLRTVRPMLLVGWAAAATPTVLVAQQTRAVAAVVAEAKQVAQARAAQALSLSVTHSVWHKDFK
jgi:hypothetical protein